jgi:hypothetical protein
MQISYVIHPRPMAVRLESFERFGENKTGSTTGKALQGQGRADPMHDWQSLSHVLPGNAPAM